MLCEFNYFKRCGLPNAYEDKDDLDRYKLLLKRLRDKNGSVEHHELKYDKLGASGLKIKDGSRYYMQRLLDAESGAIVFLNTSDLPALLHSRHAEEFLVDVAECMAAYAMAKVQKEKIHIAIGGKKRPCLSCFSRMELSEAVDSHGNHPGYLWIGRLQEQHRFTPDAANRTGKNLGLTTNVTINSNGDEDPGFGSGTEESPKNAL